jgi:hypothetical protein
MRRDASGIPMSNVEHLRGESVLTEFRTGCDGQCQPDHERMEHNPELENLTERQPL